MTLPADYTSIPVHGKWELLDGTPASGQVTFQPTQSILVDSSFVTVIMGSTLEADLVAGEISLSLPATDDPDVAGTPFAYTVTVSLNGVPSYTFNLAVPVATVGTIELATVTPVTIPNPPTGLAGGDLTGFYPNPTLSADRVRSAVLTTKGDIIVATASSTPARLGVGADGTVLTADHTQATGLKWAAGGGGGGVLLETTTVPTVDGTAAVGARGTASDSAHVHPTDTSRARVFGLNAKDFGAVGDGVADDTSALAAWITAVNATTFGALAILPAGQYLTASPLPTITAKGVTILGAGHAQTNFADGSCISAKAGYTGGAMVTLAGEGCGLEKVMIDGQGTATGLIVVTGANCRLRDFGTHGIAAGTGGVPNVCVDVQTGGVSVWITGSWRVNGINFPNTAIQVNDTDAIIEGGKPTNNTYNIVLLAGASGAKVQGCHMTPGAGGANCIWVSGSPSHVAIDNNRFDNYVQSGIQITPSASTPNSIEITDNEFHSTVITDNTYAAIALDTTLSGCRALKITGNAVYGSATHRPKNFLSAQTQAGAAATNTSRMASLGTICSANVAWAATSFYGSGSPSLARGNLTATDGQTYTVVPDIANDVALAPLASPALTGTPTVPTAAPGTNSTQAASTAYADAADKAFVTAQIHDVTLNGAVGDGVTDDTTAIQNTINLGGVTFFPAGKTFLTGKLTLAEGSVLRGTNSGYLNFTAADYSIIKLKSATNDHLIVVPVGALGVQIENLQLDGNKAGQTAGPSSVIHLPDNATYEQCQMTVDRCWVKNGFTIGVNIGAERGGCKVLRTRVYNNSNATDQNEGIRIEGADSMVDHCSVGANGGNGIGVGVGPCMIMENGIWGNLRGVQVYTTVGEVALVANGIDTNGKQGILINASADAVTLLGNILHTNSFTNANFAHIENNSTTGTVVAIGNVGGPNDSGFTNTPLQLIKCGAGATVEGYGNVVSAASTQNGVTDDYTLIANTMGMATVSALAARGLTGSTAASRYAGATASGAPTTGAHLKGDWVVDQTGKIWVCTTAGTPGTWTQVGGGGGVTLETTTVPTVDGTAAVGARGTASDSAHVHPTDTSRAALASPTFTGTPAVPTAAVDTNTTQAASTAYVIGQASAVGDGTPAMDGTAARGTGTHYARNDHVHPSDTSRLAATAAAGGDLAGNYPNPTLAVDRITKALLTTKGDVIAASAASTPARLGVGSDGQVLTADSTQATGVKWAAGGGASGPSMGTGLWYSPIGSLAPTVVMVENKLYAIPIDLGQAVTVTALGLEITAAGAASSVIRLGLYADSGGLPAAKIIDAGTIDGTVLFSTTPGAITGLSAALSAGRVWLVAVSQAQAGTQPTVKAIGQGLPLIPRSTQPGGSGQTNTGIVSNGTTTTAALPTTFPAADCGSSIPRICLST